MKYDVFISHASEDKADVARPLAIHLQHLGLKVWLDEFELTLGDSLRRSIDHGLVQSSYGVVILSPAFFSKEWPNRELDGLVAREDGRDKVILPVWHNVGADEIINYSPPLADKLAVSTSRGLDHVAKRVFEAVQHEGNEGDVSRFSLAPSESEILERLRLRMLAASNSRELRQTLYEAEGYLAKYPHSAEARLFKDSIQIAMRRAEEIERPRARKSMKMRPRANEMRRARPRGLQLWPGCLLRFLVIASSGLLLYLLYRVTI